jgi:CrcB protein
MTGWTSLAFLSAAALGAPARYVVDGWVQRRTTATFPWGILAVNVSGCLLLGFLTGLGLYQGLGSTWRTVLGTGGLGAYTTFSTFTCDTVRLTERGPVGPAVANVVSSVVVGLLAAAAGLVLAAAV